MVTQRLKDSSIYQGFTTSTLERSIVNSFLRQGTAKNYSLDETNLQFEIPTKIKF